MYPEIKRCVGYLQCLESALIGLALSIPEDLWHLVEKAVAAHKHLDVETNCKDKGSKFWLILIESRIHRLARYYKTKQQIPPMFKYDSKSVIANTLITWALGGNVILRRSRTNDMLLLVL